MPKKRTIEDVERDLTMARKRLKDLHEIGDAACSKYDLMMGYDANFYLNVCTLPANHIKYYEAELATLTKAGIQQKLF